MKAWLILTVLVVLSQQDDEAKIDWYADLIAKANKNGLRYEWPTSAKKYYSDTKRELFGSYDFVIVGGGTGGSVSANRLSGICNWTVLVLEAGHYGNNFSDIPNMYTPIEFTDFNWAYNSTPQTTACLGLTNRVCLYPRGKGVGGSSLINGQIYARGYKYDFDKWAQFANNKRWGYDSVLRYFKKTERFVHNDTRAPYDPAYHGTCGEQNVEYHQPNSLQLNAFLRANVELGFDIADYNANKLGVSPTQFNTLHGQRFDDGKAFLRPVQHRKNLHILTGSYVTKLRFDKGVVTGVEFSRKGKNWMVEAKKEVILAVGTFGTPQILMLSGVGPKRHLEELKIGVVADLEVGSTLRDNSVFYGVNVGTNYSNPVRPLKEYVREYLHGVGPLSIPYNLQGLGFYESSYTRGTGVPEIELVFVPANATNELTRRKFGLTEQTYDDLWKHNNVTSSFIVYVTVLHAESVGTVRLPSKNPYDYPLINANFISDSANKDINTMYEGVQLALKLIETKAFKAMNATLQGGPLRACKQHEYLSKGYWYCAIRQVTINLYHPLGTCPMGTNPKKGAVVDSELKVFGFKNLRIADASVIPLALAGHTHAPTVMIADQLGDLVKETYL